MFNGYLAIDGVEVLNVARAAAYVRAFLPTVEIKCDTPTLPEALGHSPYTAPDDDNAPWYLGDRMPGREFYGFYPLKIEGAEDSTYSVQVTDLSGHGAVMTSPRYGAREMRFVADGFAANEEAMEEGMRWLRDILSNRDGSCPGRTAQLFSSAPADSVAAYEKARTFHRVDVSEAPAVTSKLNSKAGVIWRVEFTLTAGVPWPFTSLVPAGDLDMDTGTNFSDPVGEDCSVNADAYDDHVDDPYFTGISRPPRPPVILPPNILEISSWRRKTLTIPPITSKRWGRVAPVINVMVGPDDAQFLRLRFYRASEGVTGCGFDGEFLVSYIPANSILTIDTITEETSLSLPDGRTVPAGHLLFGSDGRPVLWPSLGQQLEYTMTADLMPAQSGVQVILQTAVRE